MIGTIGFVVYAAMFYRDVELEADSTGALWAAVKFRELNPENSEIYLIQPAYDEKPGCFLIKKGSHEKVGVMEWNGEGRGTITAYERKLDVLGPSVVSQGLVRSTSDTVVVMEGDDTGAEIIPVAFGNPRKTAIVTRGREYMVSVPLGSERLLGQVTIDEVVVAEFARADKLSFQRARLLAVRKGELLASLPYFVWMAVFRAASPE